MQQWGIMQIMHVIHGQRLKKHWIQKSYYVCINEAISTLYSLCVVNSPEIFRELSGAPLSINFWREVLRASLESKYSKNTS